MTIRSKPLDAAAERLAAKLMDLVKPAQRSVDAIRRVAALPYAPDTAIAMADKLNALADQLELDEMVGALTGLAESIASVERAIKESQ